MLSNLPPGCSDFDIENAQRSDPLVIGATVLVSIRARVKYYDAKNECYVVEPVTDFESECFGIEDLEAI